MMLAVKSNEANVKRINLNRHAPGGVFGWDEIKAEIDTHLLATPTSVIILEEWDKMSKKNQSSLLELLDDSQSHLKLPYLISSEKGPPIDKSCAIFILTSNIQSAENSAEGIKKGIRESFTAEKGEEAEAFLSRLDGVVPFKGVESKGADEIINDYLDFCERTESLPKDKRAVVLEKLKTIKKPEDVRQLEGVVQNVVFEVVKE